MPSPIKAGTNIRAVDFSLGIQESTWLKKPNNIEVTWMLYQRTQSLTISTARNTLCSSA